MSFLQCAFGPRLFVEYTVPEEKVHVPTNMEMFGDQILSLFTLTLSFGRYTVPLFGLYLYMKGAFILDNMLLLLKFGTSIGFVMFVSWFVRGFGRQQSPQYVKFVQIFSNAKNSADAQELLKKFDYDFRSMEVSFDAKTVDKRTPAKTLLNSCPCFKVHKIPVEVAAYVAMNSFGIRMMYPGSIRALQRYLRPVLIGGRTRLVQENAAKRFKVKTYDSNYIDTVFIDNRDSNSRGETLVICCEGNAGFYEAGIISTPLLRQHSVIGWNHPGFEGSTGTPFPSQEKNAIEAVIAFAIHNLHFREEDIILHGWSIGGYSALWGACCYSNIKGIILDATFDDVVPLASTRIPSILFSVVETGIRRYCNLNNVEMLSGYDGPILIVRRLRDEIIAEDNKLETNRGNNLILALLEYRYPYIFTPPQSLRLKRMLSRPLEERTFSKKNDEMNLTRLSIFASDKGKSFPMYIGDDYNEERRTDMANYLLLKHLQDFRSTHCTPLPPQLFKMPWDIPITQGFQLA